MQAVQLMKYSKKSPVIELNDIEKPKISSNQVLVKIIAAGVNPLDNKIAHGEIRPLLPYKLPLTLGNEFVGIIEDVGKNVSNFSIGDRVFARMPIDNIGAFTKQVAIDEKAIAKVPDYLTDEEAAAVPLTALTAIQALNLLNGKPGDTLFISGGTGSFGAMDIPLAVAKGYKVITSGSERNEKRVKDLGVSEFIDYHKEDYSKVLSNIDYVIDTLGGSEIKKEMSILKKGGSIVSLNGMPNRKFAKQWGYSLAKSALFSVAGASLDLLAKKEGKNYYFLFVRSSGKELAEAADILSKDKIRPTIGKVYSLEDYQEALNQVARGHNLGKIIIRI